MFDLLQEAYKQLAEENRGYVIRVKKGFFRDVIHPAASQTTLVAMGFTKKEIRKAVYQGFLIEKFYSDGKKQMPAYCFRGRLYRQRHWFKKIIEKIIGKLFWKYYLTQSEITDND